MRKFETFEGKGKVYHAVGLFNWWELGYGPYKMGWTDPPIPTTAMKEWLEENDSRLVEFGGGAFGPPHLEFPDMKTAMKFKRTWHDTAWLRTLPNRILGFFTSYPRMRNNRMILGHLDEYDFYDYILDALGFTDSRIVYEKLDDFKS